tara:strand:- start:253 stop:501 length:249 start_codon:yes stop_codon:yes gene_type:complete
MKISVKQEIWLSLDDLRWLKEYYDGDWNWKPPAVNEIGDRLVQGILDQFIREWDLEALKNEQARHKLTKMLEVKERKIFDMD